MQRDTPSTQLLQALVGNYRSATPSKQEMIRKQLQLGLELQGTPVNTNIAAFGLSSSGIPQKVELGGLSSGPLEPTQVQLLS